MSSNEKDVAQIFSTFFKMKRVELFQFILPLLHRLTNSTWNLLANFVTQWIQFVMVTNLIKRDQLVIVKHIGKYKNYTFILRDFYLLVQTVLSISRLDIYGFD